MLASHGLHAIQGYFMAERNLTVDRSSTRTQDRKRWTAVIVGLPIGIFGWLVVVFGAPHTYLYLLGTLAALAGSLAAFLAGWTFGNVDHLSDIIGVQFTAQMAVSDSSLPMLQRPGTYLLRVTTGHAIGQDWQGQGAAGRQVISIVDRPDLADLRATLVAALTRTPPPPDDGPLPA